MNEKTYLLPHSVPAEQAVLGGLLLENRAWEHVGDRLSEEDFYRKDHQLIFRAIRELAEQGKPFDVLTVAEWAEKNHALDDIGGFVHVGTLAKDAPGVSNIQHYAETVRDRAILRRLVEAAREITEMALAGAAVPHEVLEAAGRIFTNIGKVKGKGARQLMEPLTAWLNRIDERAHSDSKLVGLSTGFGALDGILSGLENGNFYVMAGRPGMGKTTLGFNIAENFARRGDPASVFQLEMPHEQLLDRTVATNARIDSDQLRRAEFNGEEWGRIVDATNEMRSWPLYIDEEAGLSMTEIRTRARRMKREHGIKLIMVDYLQLIREKAENKTNEITKISQSLKEMAKELNVPVLALSQLSRDVERRQNKRPMPADLRDSGSIEQDADALIFLYREGVYVEDFIYSDVTEVIIGKQRNGPVGTVHLHYNAPQFRFGNLDSASRNEYIRHMKGAHARGGVKTTGGFD